MNPVIIIPSLNPDNVLIHYISELIGKGFKKIIVVNDGSARSYDIVFMGLNKKSECDLITHKKNLGKGRAIKTALRHYLKHYKKCGYSGVISVDADAQHTIEDVVKIAVEMKLEKDVLILGQRSFDKEVPLKSLFGNSITRIIFFLLYGISLKDTQTGLRGIPNKIIFHFLEIKGERFEYEMNMLITCSVKHISIKSIEIKTVYISGNASSHFKPVRDSIKIYFLLFGNIIRKKRAPN